MSLTYGFYNSVNHDRVYDAVQVSSIFDGVIGDGVYETIGDALMVKPVSGLTVSVGTGRAWFNHTWTLNDSLIPFTLSNAPAVNNRYDAIVLQVNEDARTNSILVVRGEASANPTYPTLTNTATKHQYPLAYISRTPGQTEITASQITNQVGTSACPFVIGVVKVMDIDNFVSQWSSQWDDFLDEKTSQTDNWMAENQLEFETWFNNLQVTLDDDVAANLTQQIYDLTQLVNSLLYGDPIPQTIDDNEGNHISDSSGNNIEGTLIYKPV